MKEKTFKDLGLDNGDDFLNSLGITLELEDFEKETKEQEEAKINEIKKNI